MQPDRDGWQRSQPSRREVELPDYDWQEIDWLEEPQQRAPQQRAPQQRPPQQRAPQQRPPQQRAPQQRAPQQRAPQQRASQQRASQQRAPQQRPPQQRAPQRRQDYRRADQARPRWEDDRYDRRAVMVEQDDYRPRRRHGLNRQSLPLIILVVILVGGVLFAGGKVGAILLDYHRDRSAYNDLAHEALSDQGDESVTPGPEETPVPEQAQTQSEVPIAVDWDYLKGVNADIVGWLYCPNTPINYPVMQTGDNDYYLHRSYDRQPNTAGALFADYKAVEGIPLSNFIIYGHNMKDGSMFATVYDYVDQEFYNQHPVMYYLTPTRNYRIELIAAHIVESTLDNYPGYFEGDSGYQNYLNTITSQSYFRTNASVSTQYQLITMSTCDYSSNYQDPRFLLHGQMIPIQ